ncbi:STY4851/ECs_5259 family protein [Pseudomonas fluorescens]|uniref:STY4851/ECs_5259 family protein n=1 Tax=Pseudomonas fluorescens TaxID=294 RepID=UPI000A6A316B|nr:STY4851/ECs_5259 family protein [Pseudomonas fluorescens]
MQLNQWIIRFLSEKGLDAPDGRPLFAYKTTEAQYNELKQCLRAVPGFTVGSADYCQVWLLFAAEWWKREYAGGAWRWAPLCLAAGQPGMSHEQTSRHVLAGHRQWQLTTEIRGEGKRYIGQVAINGGLPMRLLETAQGSLSRLLRMVLEQTLRCNLHQDDLLDAIKTQAALLPVSYRQDLIYQLLRDLVWGVLQLRAQYGLHHEPDPLLKLQQQCPDWEMRFPLALDSAVATTLIKGLVASVASISAQKSRVPFQIVRGLRFPSDDGMPVFEMAFEMQAQTTTQELADAVGITADKLPHQFRLLLLVAGKEHLVGEALRRGGGYQLVARKGLSLQNLHAGAQLILSRNGQAIHTAHLPGGEPISFDEPLLFEDARPFASLVGQGSATLKGDRALALIPENAFFYAQGDDAVVMHEGMPGDQVLLIISQGKTQFTYRKQSYYVTVNPNAAPRADAYWQGQTLDAGSVPGLMFRGNPSLRVLQAGGSFSYAPVNELYIRSNGIDTPFTQAKAPGLCWLSWSRGGQRLLRSRAVVLPVSASISYTPSADPAKGCILLENWPDLHVTCDSPDITLSRTYEDKTNVLTVQSKAAAPATSVQLLIQWPEGEQKLTLPFPGHGAVLLDARQVPIREGASLSVEELMGCRAILMSPTGADAWQVRLTAHSPDQPNALVREIRYTGTREIRLFELINPIQQMLSCHSGLDMSVTMQFVHSHRVRGTYHVGRYSTVARLHGNAQFVSLNDGRHDLLLDREDAEGLLMALPLALPNRDPEPLSLHLSEQVFTGSWRLNLPDNVASPWLIYASAESNYRCQPCIAPAQGIALAKVFTPLQNALCEADHETRMVLLTKRLEQMATTPMHEDWVLLEALLDKLQHLPLPSLDLYQVLIRTPAALVMVTLLLDGFAANMVERMPLELPFEWLLISPMQWLQAFEVLKNTLVTDPRLLPIIRKDIQRKSQYLPRWQPALKFIFDQGIHHHLDGNIPDARLFLNDPKMLTELWLDRLFDGPDCEMQDFFHRNYADDQPWPKLPPNVMSDFLRTDNGKLLMKRTRLSADDVKIPATILPFMVGFDACAGKSDFWQGDSSRLFALRTARQFDTAWFDSAYELSLAMAHTASLNLKN